MKKVCWICTAILCAVFLCGCKTVIAPEENCPEQLLQAYDRIAQVRENYYRGAYDYATACRILRACDGSQELLELAGAVEAELFRDNRDTIAYELAQRYRQEGNWQAAVRALESVSVQYRRYPEAVELLQVCISAYRLQVEARCEVYAERGEYDKILVCLNEALTFLDADTEMTLLRQVYADIFVNRTLVLAETLADRGEYGRAIQVLTEAGSVYKAEAFETARAEYVSRRWSAELWGAW